MVRRIVFTIPFLSQYDYHVQLRGMASRVGDRAYNQQLSLERVLRVKKYLTSRGIPEFKVPGPGVSAVGEDYSTSENQDEDMDRSVLLILLRGTKPRPIFIPKVSIGEIIYLPNQLPTETPVDFSAFNGPAEYGSVLSAPHYLAGIFGTIYKVTTGSSPGWTAINFNNPKVGLVRVKTGGTIGVTTFSGQIGTTICTDADPYRDLQPGEIESWINEKLQ